MPLAKWEQCNILFKLYKLQLFARHESGQDQCNILFKLYKLQRGDWNSGDWNNVISFLNSTSSSIVENKWPDIGM